MQPYIANASFVIFTGDVASHDKAWQLSRPYQLYEEKATYLTFKAQLGGKPLYPTIGNHDSFPSDQSTPLILDWLTVDTPYWWAQNGAVDEFQWEYDFYAKLWSDNGWLPSSSATQEKIHFGAYSVVTSQGLKIISLNTDFWYKNNFFN